MAADVSSHAAADANDVRSYLCELGELLLSWSWEGVVGYELMVSKAARAFGHDDATVIFDAEDATIRLDGDVSIVKTTLPGFPPLAATQDLKNHLADVFDGKLSVSEARDALRRVKDRTPPDAPFLVWLGVVVVSAAFAVDIVGTSEGILYAGLTGMATGLVFIAVDTGLAKSDGGRTLAYRCSRRGGKRVRRRYAAAGDPGATAPAAPAGGVFCVLSAGPSADC